MIKKTAFQTIQGTAMSETVLCEQHSNDELKYETLVLAQQDGFFDSYSGRVDCSENDECCCIVCGK